MAASLPALTAAAIANVDLDDDAAVKAAIRALTGLKRVPAEMVDEFREAAEALDDETDEALDDETDEEPSEGRSVVKRAYKTRYKPFKSTCGDELAALVRRHLEVKTEEGLRIDPVKLRTFAVANDCWQDRYNQLNVGMRRMNVVNRLRAKVKKGHDIVWA